MGEAAIARLLRRLRAQPAAGGGSWAAASPAVATSCACSGWRSRWRRALLHGPDQRRHARATPTVWRTRRSAWPPNRAYRQKPAERRRCRGYAQTVRSRKSDDAASRRRSAVYHQGRAPLPQQRGPGVHSAPPASAPKSPPGTRRTPSASPSPRKAAVCVVTLL